MALAYSMPQGVNLEKAAAIDIGSNAIRMVIGGYDEHDHIQIYRKMREAVRLGKDVFEKNKMISAESFGAALKAFEKFRKAIDEQDIKNVRAVATSAVREATNGKEFVDTISKTYGIKVQIIDGIEEAKLIQRAVESEIPLSLRRALLIDIGGGSVEITVTEGNKIQFMESLPLGTVRLLKMAEKEKLSDKDIEKVITETLAGFAKKLAEIKRKTPLEIAIGTGGNVECLGVVRAALFNKSSMSKVYLEELDKIIKKLDEMSYKERIDKWKLKPDRADVILPASLVVRKVMQMAEIETLQIPRVGLKDGLLLSLLKKA